MCQDGNCCPHRSTTRENPMDKGRSGIIMEAYTSGNSMMKEELKVKSMSCNKTALTHSSMLNIIIGMRL
jgi:hypothetical protein